jgi:hypothetical protein
MARCLLVSCLLLACSGCLQYELNRKSVRLTTTTNDLIYGQVLNKLALTIDNPMSLPYFDMPSSGTMQLQGSVSGNYTPTWMLTAIGTYLLNTQAASIMPTLLEQGAWQMSPVADPDRLFLMNCAYRTVTGSSDPECAKVLSEFYAARDAWVELAIRQNVYGLRQVDILDRMWQNIEKIERQHEPSSDALTELAYLRNLYGFFAPPATGAAPPPAGGLPGSGGGGGGGGGGSASREPNLVRLFLPFFARPFLPFFAFFCPERVQRKRASSGGLTRDLLRPPSESAYPRLNRPEETIPKIDGSATVNRRGGAI